MVFFHCYQLAEVTARAEKERNDAQKSLSVAAYERREREAEAERRHTEVSIPSCCSGYIDRFLIDLKFVTGHDRGCSASTICFGGF
jgi:hypothetical protein